MKCENTKVILKRDITNSKGSGNNNNNNNNQQRTLQSNVNGRMFLSFAFDYLIFISSQDYLNINLFLKSKLLCIDYL